MKYFRLWQPCTSSWKFLLNACHILQQLQADHRSDCIQVWKQSAHRACWIFNAADIFRGSPEALDKLGLQIWIGKWGFWLLFFPRFIMQTRNIPGLVIFWWICMNQPGWEFFCVCAEKLNIDSIGCLNFLTKQFIHCQLKYYKPLKISLQDYIFHWNSHLHVNYFASHKA